MASSDVESLEFRPPLDDASANKGNLWPGRARRLERRDRVLRRVQ
jgi:hypothetical protein